MTELPSHLIRSPKFEPRLRFEDRCAILALNRKRVSIALLAAAFGVNRRTINKITSEGSDRYREVKDRLRAMGLDLFYEEYVTPDHIKMLESAKHDPEVDMGAKDYDAQGATGRSGRASPKATKHSGINTIKLEHHTFSHRIEVSWLEANTAVDDDGPFEHPAGWYWRDLDGDAPDRWQGDPDAMTHLSSTRAYEHARKMT